MSLAEAIALALIVVVGVIFAVIKVLQIRYLNRYQPDDE
ncbi:hypothetical protein SAMN04489842_2629 [Natronobacterium texcoconense]|uniref:Uncharacterized protein n=1 Tax=Natronobacterium texcoconense TaxID=1095778 RepID=A0A1H1GV38_NATTX|nr:hypothetical protein SAMN04489842_2629 [Natronobacterium texcoconense]